MQQQTAGAGITNINGQLNAQFGGMSFTAGFGFFPSLFGLQFQVTEIKSEMLRNRNIPQNSLMLISYILPQNFAPPLPPAPTDGSRPLTTEERDQATLSICLMVLGGTVFLGLVFF